MLYSVLPRADARPDCLDCRLPFKRIGKFFSRMRLAHYLYIPRTVIPSPSFYNHAVAHCRCSGCPRQIHFRFVRNNPLHDRIFNDIGIGTTTRSRGATAFRRSWTHDFDAKLLGSSVFRQRRYCREISAYRPPLCRRRNFRNFRRKQLRRVGVSRSLARRRLPDAGPPFARYFSIFSLLLQVIKHASVHNCACARMRVCSSARTRT